METLSKEQSEAIIYAARGVNIDPDDIRTDYSGRGMFGETCFGIVGGDQEYAGFLLELAEDDKKLAKRLADSVSTDSMGMETIYYWRSLKLAG